MEEGSGREPLREALAGVALPDHHLGLGEGDPGSAVVPDGRFDVRAPPVAAPRSPGRLGRVTDMYLTIRTVRFHFATAACQYWLKMCKGVLTTAPSAGRPVFRSLRTSRPEQ